MANHDTQRHSQKENANDPHETDKTDEIATLRDQVIAWVRVIWGLWLEISSTYLAGKVESESMQDKDCPETKNIIDHECLIEGCKGCRLFNHSDYHNDWAEYVHYSYWEENL